MVEKSKKSKQISKKFLIKQGEKSGKREKRIIGLRELCYRLLLFCFAPEVIISPTRFAKGGLQASLQNRDHCALDDAIVTGGIVKADWDNAVAAPLEIRTPFGIELQFSTELEPVERVQLINLQTCKASDYFRTSPYLVSRLHRGVHPSGGRHLAMKC